MSQPPTTQLTCWTLILGAAEGDARSRSEFARLYLPMVKRCLKARWRGSALSQDIDDAAQEVFLECVREGGALVQADRAREGGFRAFLFGVVRNVARRFETRRGGGRVSASVLGALESGEDDLGVLLDREWARCLMVEATERQRSIALAAGQAARKRVELLRLRFEEGLPIREIAARWQADPATVHAAYRLARREFQDALRNVVVFHHGAGGGVHANVDAECLRLLELLDEA
jgi:RNA polymerase sigma factor (sigma-70 family)